MKEPKKIRVVKDQPVPEEEIKKARNFKKLVSRFDEARKPLYNRSLFRYRQRWIFFAILLIVLIILLIFNVI